MKQAKVSELKAHLSAYLGLVREHGEPVEVYDRKTPIALIVPLERDQDVVVIDEPARPDERARKVRPVRPRRPVDVDALLRESRDQ
jgi:antitoxin (DNA-binding transcriptional repressor) of toxin-antitoxin stability system